MAGHMSNSESTPEIFSFTNDGRINVDMGPAISRAYDAASNRLTEAKLGQNYYLQDSSGTWHQYDPQGTETQLPEGVVIGRTNWSPRMKMVTPDGNQMW